YLGPTADSTMDQTFANN
nr:RecName: Full=Peroxidase 5 [Daucus carota]